jgi:hypothetical protein
MKQCTKHGKAKMYNGVCMGAHAISIEYTDVPDPAPVEASPAPTHMDREQKAEWYKRQSGKTAHASDCATSCAPAEEPGPCDCDAKDAKAEISPASSHTIAELMLMIERDNARWWRDLTTGEPIDRNIGELLMLMVSELAEAMEGHRKNLMDDKLPHRKMFEVELADLVIRVLDTAVHYAPGLESAVMEKLAYNRIREDHKEENRRLPNGKKY